MVCSKSSQSPDVVVRFELPNCAMQSTNENEREYQIVLLVRRLWHHEFFEKNLNCVATAHTQNQEKNKVNCFIYCINHLDKLFFTKRTILH
jgi:hypothetical protein